MGDVLMFLQRKPTQGLTPAREFLVENRAVGIALIACTIFLLTLSFLPATQSVCTSFWQHAAAIAFGAIAGLVLCIAVDGGNCNNFIGHMECAVC